MYKEGSVIPVDASEAHKREVAEIVHEKLSLREEFA